MRRVLDLVLVVVLIGAVVFGVLKLGHLVDNKSNEAADESAGTTVSSTVASHDSSGPSRHTIEVLGEAAAGAAAVLILVSFGGSVVRRRRRQSWHSS